MSTIQVQKAENPNDFVNARVVQYRLSPTYLEWLLGAPEPSILRKSIYDRCKEVLLAVEPHIYMGSSQLSRGKKFFSEWCIIVELQSDYMIPPHDYWDVESTTVLAFLVDQKEAFRAPEDLLSDLVRRAEVRWTEVAVNTAP